MPIMFVDKAERMPKLVHSIRLDAAVPQCRASTFRVYRPEGEVQPEGSRLPIKLGSDADRTRHHVGNLDMNTLGSWRAPSLAEDEIN
jgi:hypothetical protein